MTARPPHVAMLATPGMGHLIPLAELARRLASRHGATATLLTFASTASATQRAFLASLPPAVASLRLPPVDLSDLPRGATIETRMSEETARSVPAIAEALTKMETTCLVAFVTDIFGTDAFDAARAAGVGRRYLFNPTNLHMLSLLLRLPELDASVPGAFRDLDEPVRLTGCVPIPGAYILSPLQDKGDPCYRWMLHHAARCREADAILVNSFDAVEPEAAAVLCRKQETGRPPVYNVGPLILTETDTKSSPRAACLEWLDRQPARSVIFVSFGSGGALRTEQMRELALGLELSGQRFPWVVRSPSDEGAVSDNYYDAESKEDPFVFLPEGFVERTKDVGFLVASWAPQIGLLAHEATGGFLTHCGWNSTLESLVHGAWRADGGMASHQNAVMLAEGIGAVIPVPEPKRKETVARVVKELMAGEQKGAAVRATVAELQKAALEGLGEGGAATTALAEVVEKWAT
ncbi:UDP-glycosyltransferase 72B3-like [Panicum miliaceum]|uniref:UDP-glycosyltransferase 72B3-like n=1 Tax=Panicum miliaceum TaxID=4540 RepID=A0A3L6PL98_PANMI|nr:UDP-glycosyltransferase 72B3-like [Panicum miliaceum]